MTKSKAETQRDYEKRTGYAAQKKYKEQNTKRIILDINLRTEDDILQKILSEPNRQAYIKGLIRADIAKNK